jgi:3-phosphoglycerate kinase
MDAAKQQPEVVDVEAEAFSSGHSVAVDAEAVAAARLFGVADDVTHLCTGGAAMEYIAGSRLPAILALEERG